MKVIGDLLLVSVVPAALKAAVAALLFALVLAGLVSLMRQPRERWSDDNAWHAV